MTDGGGDANAMRPSSDGSGLPVIFKWTHGGQQALAEPELQIGNETSGRFVEKIESKLYQLFELATGTVATSSGSCIVVIRSIT